MKYLFYAALTLLFLADTTEAQRTCKTGIPCGKSCISANKTCRIQSVTSSDSSTRKDIKSETSAKDTSSKGTTHAQDTTDSNAKVWVNTSSRVYHCAGSRYYGTTANGKYLSERDAIAQGHRPAYGKKCSM